MADIVIIGDGPAGLSAALFLAKNGHGAILYAQDETPMNRTQLLNYLGVDDERGPDFQERARRQVRRHGAEIRHERVTAMEPEGVRFRISSDSGHGVLADYVIIAAGKKGKELASMLGIHSNHDGVDVDAEYRTRIDRVYAIGRSSRPARSQAIISAGAGAIAALDILAREAGGDVTDWDRLDQESTRPAPSP